MEQENMENEATEIIEDTEIIKETNPINTDLVSERLLKAEAKAQALALGVKPEKINYVLKLAELSPSLLNSQLEIDENGVSKAIKKVLADVPEFGQSSDSETITHFKGANPISSQVSKKEQYRAKIAEAKEKGKATDVIALKLKAFGEGIIIT